MRITVASKAVAKPDAFKLTRMTKPILSGALTNFENFLRTFEPRFQDYF
jgi:hypothetical protein